jgi:RNA polymerase sigma-70 factor, ECF subfamily
MTFMAGLFSAQAPPRAMNERTWTEADLIEGCRAGRREAFDALVSLYHDRLFRLAYAMAGPEAAADLVQDTFLAAVQAFPRFRAESQLSTWLISILRNQFSLFLRGRKKWKLSPLSEDDLQLRAPEPPEVEQNVREILDRVKDLPEELRSTLVLFHVDGMSYADIARAMDCPIGTVRSRLFEARERLKKLVMKADPR